MIENQNIQNFSKTKDAGSGIPALGEKTIEKTAFWSPPVPSWEPLKHKKNTHLRMACMVEERLYQGLRFEGEVMILTPLNWKQILEYGKPDFILMESVLISSCGHWHMGPNEASSEQKKNSADFSVCRQIINSHCLLDDKKS